MCQARVKSPVSESQPRGELPVGRALEDTPFVAPCAAILMDRQAVSGNICHCHAG